MKETITMTETDPAACTGEVDGGPCGHLRGDHKEVNTAGEVACWRCQEQARGGGQYLHLHRFQETRND